MNAQRPTDGALADLPAGVQSYLRDHAPQGTLIARWVDRHDDLNVIMLFARDGAPCFSACSFPQQLSRWREQLIGNHYTVDEMAVQLAHGLWDADRVALEKVRQLLDGLKAEQPPATRPS